MTKREAVRIFVNILGKWRGEGHGLAIPSEAQFLGVEGMMRKPQDALVFIRPVFGDELQVKIRVRAVDFVADHGVADVGEMYAQLMQSAGVGAQAQK